MSKTAGPRKTGYLLEDFRIFYNADRNADQKLHNVSLHYHDFHKIVILLAGNAGYTIEGHSFDMLPGDMVLVRAGAMHRPIIRDSSLYERLIIYISPAFSYDSLSAGSLFGEIRAGQELVRPGEAAAKEFSAIFSRLRQLALEDEADGPYATRVYRRIKTAELMILIKRCISDDPASLAQISSSAPMASAIMEYISRNLRDPQLDVDKIAEHVSLNRSYLMHYFREQTGYTVGNYIAEKRLFLARSLILGGMNATDACYACGFGSYSAFYRAYRKKYALSPARRVSPDRLTQAQDHDE